MLLPGITAELIDAGAVTYEALSEMYFSVHGHPVARVALNRGTILASRPLIEAHVRRRVRALPGVEIRDRCDVAGLVAAPGRITGVRVLPRADGSAEEVLAADLVVAAGGRAGRLPAWLEGLGYPRPQEDRVAIDLMYASRPIRIAPGALGPDKLVLIGARPGLPRHARARGPGARPLAAHARRLPRPPSADRPGGLRRLRGERRPAGRRGRHPRRRAARRHRHARLPGQPAAPLRAPAPVPRRPDPDRRRGLQLQPALRPGHDRLGARGGRAAPLPGRRSRTGSPGGSSPPRPPRSTTRGRWRSAATSPCPRSRAARPARLRAINAYLGRLQAVAEHDPVVAAAFVSVVAMLEKPQRLLRPVDRPPGGDGVIVNGIRTVVREAGPCGDDEAVVFVHGNPGSSADWEPLLPVAGMRAVAWDAPGFGQADKPERLPADARRPRRVHRRRPERARDRARPPRPARLRRAVGPRVGGLGARARGERDADRHRAAARLPLALARAAVAHARARRGLHGHHHAAGLPDAAAPGQPARPARRVRRPHVRRLRRGDEARRAAALPVGRRSRRRGRARAGRSLPDVPALVLWGGHDPYLSYRLAARQREAFPAARCVVLPESGHWPFADDPGRVAHELTAFLRSARRARYAPA